MKKRNSKETGVANLGKRRIQRSPRISVIIAGMPSVGKTTAAETIGRKFHLSLLAGGDMLKEIAMEKGYHPSGAEWWDGPEGMKFLSDRKHNANFDREVDQRLIANVKKGGVVVTSYTVPWICKDGLKLWFAASQKTRARRLAGRDHFAYSKAIKVVKKRDADNKRLYSRLYDIRFGEDLSVFNYIVDTENMSAKDVARAACNLVKRFISSKQKRKERTLRG